MNLLIDFLKSQSFIYLLVAIASFILFIFLCKKYKLNKQQILIFAIFTIFWMAVIIFRSYRKAYAMSPMDTGGLELSELLAVSITSIYGLISIFIRLPLFIITDFFKSRKFFIGLSMITIFITSLLVSLHPSYVTLFASSLAIGIAASFISLFNVMFAESFTKENAILSVSIFSLSPLLAEFLMAPLQFFATNSTPKNYSSLWIISCIFSILALIILYFIKDNKEKIINFSFPKLKKVLLNKTFIVICLLGIFSSLIKFATSGSNFVALGSLKEINLSAFELAYSDVIFAGFQLIAGVLTGIYLKKKIGVKNTLIIGFAASLLFSIMPIITTNSTVLFISYAFNGIGYGIVYNLLIGLAMQPFDKDKREISMGIYQTFFAIGIYFGDRIYGIIYNLFQGDTLFNIYQNVYVIISIITAILLLFVIFFFTGKNKKFIES